MTKTVKVLLVVQAILIAVVLGLVTAIVAIATGALVVTATGVGGAVFLTAVPVVLGAQKAVTG